jgi:hypothetical protein
MYGHYTTHKKALAKNKRASKDPDIEEAMSQWSNVEKKARS